ncbi:IQ-DOMAIN 31-like protein [Drosera capensis]
MVLVSASACRGGFMIFAMGKSPGKWIKSVLFGKKSSKSHVIKHKEQPGTLKVVNGSAKAPENLPAFIPPVGWKCVEDENGLCCSLDLDKLNLGSERRKDLEVQQNGRMHESGHQSDEAEQPVVSEPERIMQEKAATKAQAAFRGYLALKGIIRLQALIRGHLARRQAASTLFCVIGIVRLQAVARGSRIRCADVDLEVRKVCTRVKRQENSLPGPSGVDVWKKIAISSGSAFVGKVLAPSSTVMPLLIQYESADPNSHVNWLERWSMSCPWKPSPCKKPRNQKSQKMQGTPQTVEKASGKPKGSSVRKVHSSISSTSSQIANDFKESRRSLKKVPSNSAESLQENPQGELEKIKRNLRKMQKPVTESPVQAEVVNETLNQNQGKVTESLVQPEVVNEEPNQNQGESLTESTIQPEVSNEKPDQNQDKSSNSNCHDVSVANGISESEEVKDETTTTVNEGTRAESEPGEGNSLKSNDTVESSSISDQSVAIRSLPERNVKDENVPPSNEKSKYKEDSPLVKYQKSARRVTFPVKRDRLVTLNNGVQNIPKLPSYMAATESAKAKLRGLGSPRLSQDGMNKNIISRRHSLPYTNGKLNSPSPRTLKPAQVMGKGCNKRERSLLPPLDGNGMETGPGRMAKMNREMAKFSHHDVIVMNFSAICIFNKFLYFSLHFALMRSFWPSKRKFQAYKFPFC